MFNLYISVSISFYNAYGSSPSHQSSRVDYTVVSEDSATMSEFLFVEKYRPQTIEDTILPQSLETHSKNSSIKVRYLILCYGSAGVGKTTVAKSIM